MRKMLATSLAAVGVVGLIGGGTFANWSDFDSFGSEVNADELMLDLESEETLGFASQLLAPGEGEETDIFVASRTGTTVANAGLTMTMTGLAGSEDGCGLGNSEVVADPDCGTDTVGELPVNATITISTSLPGTLLDCATVAYTVVQPAITLDAFQTATGGTPLNLLHSSETLQPGDGVCVSMVVGLPFGAGNDTQGDGATFDLTLDLTQLAS